MRSTSSISFELPSIDTMETLCYNYYLDGVEVFELLSDDEKRSEWNGFGPNRFPKWLRNFLTLKEWVLLPACYIHDLDYAVGGSKKYFYASNRRFRKNAMKCIAKHDGFYWLPYKVYVILKIRLIEILCNLFGYRGWKKK